MVVRSQSHRLMELAMALSRFDTQMQAPEKRLCFVAVGKDEEMLVAMQAVAAGMLNRRDSSMAGASANATVPEMQLGSQIVATVRGIRAVAKLRGIPVAVRLCDTRAAARLHGSQAETKLYDIPVVEKTIGI